MNAVYSSHANPLQTPAFRRGALLVCISLLALLLTACGSSSSGSSNNSNDTELSSGALVSAYAYQMVLSTALGIADEDDEDEIIESRYLRGVPEARRAPTDEIKRDCNIGTERHLKFSDGEKWVYDDCQRLKSGIQYEWDGQFSTTQQTPVGAYANTDLMEFDNLKFRQSTGSRHYEMIMDGHQKLSYTRNEAMAGETNMKLDIDYRCTAGEETFTQRSEGDFQIDYHAEGFRYESNGSSSIRGHSKLNGNFSYETIEPLEFASSRNSRPYMGTMKVSAFNGTPVTLRFEQSGVYINDNFQSWEAFLNLSGSAFASPVIC